jgi:hypothetical protein
MASGIAALNCVVDPAALLDDIAMISGATATAPPMPALTSPGSGR